MRDLLQLLSSNARSQKAGNPSFGPYTPESYSAGQQTTLFKTSRQLGGIGATFWAGKRCQSLARGGGRRIIHQARKVWEDEDSNCRGLWWELGHLELSSGQPTKIHIGMDAVCVWLCSVRRGIVGWWPEAVDARSRVCRDRAQYHPAKNQRRRQNFQIYICMATAVIRLRSQIIQYICHTH